MIAFEKAKTQIFLQFIDTTLAEGGKVYKICLDFAKLTTSIDKQISYCRYNLIQISNSYNPIVNLTDSLDGPILVIMDQILKLEKERDNIIKRETELHNFIVPRLDNLLFHKIGYISNMQKDDPRESEVIEYYTSLLNEFTSILNSLK